MLAAPPRRRAPPIGQMWRTRSFIDRRPNGYRFGGRSARRADDRRSTAALAAVELRVIGDDRPVAVSGVVARPR
jgi:hypothetical protein